MAEAYRLRIDEGDPRLDDPAMPAPDDPADDAAAHDGDRGGDHDDDRSLRPSEAARARRRARDADAPARDLLRPGMGKVFKQSQDA